MYKSIISTTVSIVLTALLSGCITPVSSGCANNQHFKTPNDGSATSNQNCSEVEAAIYLASALYIEAQKTPDREKATTNPPPKNAKCSHLVGKSQKECIRSQEEAYDPLDEL